MGRVGLWRAVAKPATTALCGESSGRRHGGRGRVQIGAFRQASATVWRGELDHRGSPMAANIAPCRQVSASPDHAWITHSSTRDEKMALTKRKTPGQGHNNLCAA